MRVPGKPNFQSLLGRIMAGLALAGLIASFDAIPANAREHGDRGKHGNRGDRGDRGGDHDRRWHGNRGHGHDRGHYRDGRWYPAYGYLEPVYVPPPVYYEPAPAPGISIFLPTIHIR